MNATVLVVDDAENAGLEFARLITAATALEVVLATTPQEALLLASKHPIAVVVLDQRIGKELGTDLHEELRRIDPRVRSIMFSGAASQSEVGNALELGYSRYLSKADVAKLSQVVSEEALQYSLSSALEAIPLSSKPLYTSRHGIWPFFREIKYYLSNMKVLPFDAVALDWVQVIRINAGENQKIEHSTARVNEVSFEEEFSGSAGSSLGLSSKKLGNLTASLTSEVAARVKSSQVKSENVSQGREQTYRLPEEPSDPDVLHIKSRVFERAQVKQAVRITLVAKCDCCSSTSISAVRAVAATSTYATRQVDYLSNGVIKTIDTGFENLDAI